MKKTAIILLTAMLSAPALFTSCDLTETQKSAADVALIFGSETGLQAYCYDFYGNLPTNVTIYQGDSRCDYFVQTSIDDFGRGIETPETKGSWGWEDIRNVNYFLDHNTYASVPEDVRNNYSGIARFFRAYLYFDKLVTYGEVPWIDHVLNPGDPDLTYPRDTRDKIMEEIINDLDFAYEHIKLDNSASCRCNFVNKWCALLLKSRVCLYEGSFRKYHAGSEYLANCTETPSFYFEQAAAAADELIKNGPFSLHTGEYTKDGSGPYRALFSSDICPSDEVMLAVSSDQKLATGYANYYFNKQDVRPSLSRPFVNTYLNIDGSVYSDTKADGSYKTFLEETTGRDLRLNQTIRAYDYQRKDVNGVKGRATANYNYCLTGYHITKYTVDDASCDVYGANGNDIPVMRFAEALLNYAEAKAELGTLTNDDWKTTIGALRRRAGITGGDLDKKPTIVDTKFKNTYFPSISDPVILEIRRERAIELCLEGFRWNDLIRWNCGKLWQDAKWTGIFVPALDTPLDMNGDGVYDVYYADHTDPKEYADIMVWIASPAKFISVSGGKIIEYARAGRVWKDCMTLKPVSSDDILMNPNLTQNPGY